MSASWRSAALCRHFPDLSWIVEPTDRTPSAEAAMAVVCLSCPVQVQCEMYADRWNVTSGFWAGKDRTPVSGARDETGAA